MTRVESLLSQIIELTPSQRDKLGEMFDRNSWKTSDPQLSSIISQVRDCTLAERLELGALLDDQLHNSTETDEVLTAEQMAEIYRRIDDFESGRAVCVDIDELFRELDATLKKRQKQA